MKYNFLSKTHYKFFFLSSVSTNDSESYINEGKKKDLLDKCMQSISIEERGEEHLMLT